MAGKKEKNYPFIQAVKLPTLPKAAYDIAPVLEEDKQSNSDTIRWGEDDCYPHRAISFIKGSSTAKANLKTYKKFVQGYGLNQNGELKANHKETWNQVLAKISLDMTYFRMFACRVMYSVDGKFKAFEHIPVEWVRFMVPEHEDSGKVNKVRYNPYFGTPYYEQEKQLTKTLPAFDPKSFLKEFQEQKYGYKGQIYVGRLMESGEYHYPEKFSSMDFNLFDTERKIAEFNSRNLDNNFLLSVLIKVVGNPHEMILTNPEEDDPEKHQYKRADKLFEEMLEEKFSGSSVGGSAAVLWSQVSEDFPDIQAFPSNTNADLFLALKENTKENITTVTGVPSLLSNIQSSASIQNTDGILNAIQLLNTMVQEEQQEIEAFFNKIASNFEGAEVSVPTTIQPLNPIQLLPDWARAVMTREEIRQHVSEFYPIDLDESGDTVIEEQL